MCGIAGLVSSGQPLDLNQLQAMSRMLVHRGPDDHGEWMTADGLVGLASRRLAILDLTPAGHQPMLSADGTLALVYNGELYNYLELRQELIGQGRRFRSQTDTEVILEAYAEWGEGCVARFNGMFAFAIWDARHRRLFAARDRFGEKPFYYHRSPNRLVFASEIKALLQDPETPRRPELPVVARYLETGQLDGDARTFFADICQLEPAHTLLVDASGTLRTTRYWDVSLNAAAHSTDLPEAADEFRALLFDSIRLRLRSDVAVGSSLSGGLDSSSIVCAARTLLGDDQARQNTFSARYRSGPDEGRFIQAVVDRTGVASHHVFIDGDEVMKDLERFLWYQDEPVAHTSQYAQWKVMQLSNEAGVTVLLDGQGADEVIGGYPSPSYGAQYADLLQRGRWLQLAGELAAFRRQHGSVRPALRYMGGELLPAGVRRRARAEVHGTSRLRVRGINGIERPRRHDANAPRLRNALHTTLTSTSLPSLLRYGDRSSMAFSRETRLPFLDHRLVEFAYGLPSDFLVRHGLTKVLLREAMRDVIPESVRLRTDKIGFATPERQWLSGPLRPWIAEALTGLARRDILDEHVIDDQSRRFEAGGPSGPVWRLANLEAWFRQFIDRVPQQPPVVQ